VLFPGSFLPHSMDSQPPGSASELLTIVSSQTNIVDIGCAILKDLMALLVIPEKIDSCRKK